jgi:hypothetical protein
MIVSGSYFYYPGFHKILWKLKLFREKSILKKNVISCDESYRWNLRSSSQDYSNYYTSKNWKDQVKKNDKIDPEVFKQVFFFNLL